MFIALGLSGVIPALHFVITDGFYEAVNNASLGWLCLMAFCYIFGAVIYAVRVPERIWPGKFDIWVSSWAVSVSVFTSIRSLGGAAMKYIYMYVVSNFLFTFTSWDGMYECKYCHIQCMP